MKVVTKDNIPLKTHMDFFNNISKDGDLLLYLSKNDVITNVKQRKRRLY